MAVKDIEVLENSRTVDRVLIEVVGSSYNRYVNAADWDPDPEAIAAQIAEYIDAQQKQPATVPSVGVTPVILKADEVVAKLAEIVQAKAEAAAETPTP